ncbi:OpgC domain-containing protein [Bradyrhizobium barranii subsp. barranii]|uniref:OpgC domain-containing protein n=1 Tax=Bradyrhizobium barranii subsp. barranii TaxID=2823807 RepID=A0A7Z0QLW9_9BRAD|nr:OpgC domain-containing protein [Bradyrhizobium barranii]UGX98075.1 OpgC domain-containing protein [Bradyrhizobium barranii subsp. barranii]
MGPLDNIPDRDIRLDACRGIALWFVFINHIPGNICSWLTLSHYGFSDTTEVFMFVSGLTCTMAYGHVFRSAGTWATICHTVRRSWEIYSAFLLLTLFLVVAIHRMDADLADATNVAIVLQQPGEALSRAAILQYRPVNTDVLPTFVLFHLVFAPWLLLLLRWPNAALAASALLYGLVQIYGWNFRGWPTNDWYFNPLAWQFLVTLGGWWVVVGRWRLMPLVTSRPVIMLSAAYLIWSLAVAMSWISPALELAVPQLLKGLIYPINKPDLDPLRLLHFLALAVCVTNLVPAHWAALRSRVLLGAVCCGENSLEVYCVGVLLSLAAYIFLRTVSDGLLAQVMVTGTGIALLTVFATLLTWFTGLAAPRVRLL